MQSLENNETVSHPSHSPWKTPMKPASPTFPPPRRRVISLESKTSNPRSGPCKCRSRLDDADGASVSHIPTAQEKPTSTGLASLRPSHDNGTYVPLCATPTRRNPLRSKPHLPIAAALYAACLSSPAAIIAQAQTVPSDAQIVASVTSALSTERALQGQNIVPTSSHGVLTLSGTVSSEAAKVLASIEAGQVSGVKSVLNNLIIGGSPTTSATAAPHQSATTEKSVTLPAETLLPIRITKTLTSQNAKTDDKFYGLVTNNVFQQGVIVIPAGTSVLGRVVESKPAPRLLGFPLLSIELLAIQLPKQDGSAIDQALHTTVLSSRGTAGGQGSSPGIDGMGGLGVTGPPNRPNINIVIREASQIRFHTSAPLPITVYMKNGIQLTLPPTPGPAAVPTQSTPNSIPPVS